MARKEGEVLKTTTLDLANHTESGIWQKAIKGGVLAGISGQIPQLMTGSTDMFTFTGTPKAELVGEAVEKSNTGQAPSKVTVKTYKIQVTERMSQELIWADEDYKLGIYDALLERVGTALSRSLDLLAIHGINPLTGAVSPNVTQYLTKAGNNVHIIDATTDAESDLGMAAQALQTAGYNATGIAFDPIFAGILARSKDDSGQPLYPELGLGFNVQGFQGLPAVSSDTVSGRQEGVKTGVKAIIGDFRDSFKWGIAREVPLVTIYYGDPDGNGDLMRHNEIALRAEVVFGFAFLDDGNGFSVIADSVSS